jgi:cephalosporin-C deacetylase-like acetyl esterase
MGAVAPRAISFRVAETFRIRTGPNRAFPFLLFAGAAFAQWGTPPPQQLAFEPYHASGIYDVDETVGWTVNMYLRDSRALDYLLTGSDWDGKTIMVMGGQQSLVLAGPRPQEITSVLVCVPACADTNGDVHGRKAGYPNWPSDKPDVMKAALYFDTVNFASRIKAPVMAGFGFIDTISPPAGVWTVLNQIRSLKEPLPMIESEHDNLTPNARAGLPGAHE